MSEPTPEPQAPPTLESLAAARQAAPGTPNIERVFTTAAGPGTPSPTTQPAAPGGQEPPPWEKAGEPFDPERAWSRIQNMQRDLESARTRVTEFEQAAMTDQQRLEARATEAERTAAESQRELMRYRVAAETGVPADLLHGDDEASMTAQAQQVLAFRGEQPPRAPSFDGGARTPAPGVDMNVELRRRLRG